MTKKVDRAVHGPSWTEVILGAFLSLLLGIVLGAALLILRPVVIAKEEPKERERNTVYFIEGSRDGGRARQALEKRKAFVGGQSVSVTEEEINALIAPGGAGAPPAKKAPEKGKDGKAAEAAGTSNGYFTPGAANVRVRDGVMQIGLPLTIDLIDTKVIAQARGGFEKEGDLFVFKPTELYLGSCPLERVPFLSGLVSKAFSTESALPEDIKTAWQKLAKVEVVEKTVKLTMP